MVRRWQYRRTVGNKDVGNLERLGNRARCDLQRGCGDDEIASARRLGQHLKLATDSESGEPTSLFRRRLDRQARRSGCCEALQIRSYRKAAQSEGLHPVF